MTTPFIGEIRLLGFQFAPRGWATCQGQLMSIGQNEVLFAIIGTTYGGDGQSTFALPDLRGRVPVSQGQGPGLSDIVIGQVAGAEQRTLTQALMPAHGHTVTPAAATSADSKVPTGRIPGLSSTASYADAPGSTTLGTTPTTPAGGSAPFPTRSPFLGANYCIALEGVFPSRN